jgi:hypothetical protein
LRGAVAPTADCAAIVGDRRVAGRRGVEEARRASGGGKVTLDEGAVVENRLRLPRIIHDPGT